MKKRKAPPHQLNQLVNQAMNLFIAGQLDLASSVCKQILSSVKHEPNALNLLGKIAEKSDDDTTAMELYIRGSKHHPDHPGLMASLAQLHSKMDDNKSAIDYWRKLARIQPNNPHVLQALSAQLGKTHQWGLAEDAAKKALQLNPKSAPLQANLGRVLMKQSRHNEAIELLKAAHKQLPEDLEITHDYAMAKLESGAMDEAFSIFHSILEFKPHDARALHMLLRFNKNNTYHEVMQQAESALNASTLSQPEKGLIAFGLGKAWEDCKEYDKAFELYAMGNSIYRAHKPFDLNALKQAANSIIKEFSAERLASHTPDEQLSKQPLFIVGLPRCGSTLLSSILSSHPDTVDTGETDILSDLAGALTGGDCNTIIYDNIGEVTITDLRKAAAEYMETMNRLFGDASIYIDKALPNFWLIGFIRIMFPHAKIIHCQRDALDNALSIFCNDFIGSSFDFSYDLEDIGAYYQIYQGLMAYWRTVIPPEHLYEISYESLVSDPESEIKQLISFCDIEWNDQFLKFHESERAVQTASLAQVRQPIYKSSMKRWKRFEKHLRPLIKALGDYGKTA